MRTSSSEENESNPEISDQDIIERQALKFAREFSALYKSEKKKRKELEGLSNELKDRNEELMDIIFLTSDQFLESLNNIEANLKVIKEHANSARKGLFGWFDDTERSVKRLYQMVNEMSKLYRIKSSRSLFRSVPMEEVLAEVLADLETALKKKSVTVHVGPLPVLETDRVQIRILFRELIFLMETRYQSAGEVPVINIGAACNSRGLWRITLESQGVDFEKHGFGFEKFEQRNCLDRSLDLCQRISQRLGGFLYGERGSKKSFFCHVVLPAKTIPLVSCLKSQTGIF